MSLGRILVWQSLIEAEMAETGRLKNEEVLRFFDEILPNLLNKSQYGEVF